MTVEILISCMDQTDTSIIERTGVQTDVVVINQCNTNAIETFQFKNKYGKICNAKFISTTERGLSRSRNMAIRNSSADICVLCDDDELLDENIETIVLNAYKISPASSLILFSLKREDTKKKYPTQPRCLSYIDILKASSVQITFRRNEIIKNNIYFDERMGAGTGNGGGEENKFLFDCRRKTLGMRYCPHSIALLKSSESSWFKGFTSEYIENLGWSSRRSQGSFLGFIYCMYWIVDKYSRYCDNLKFSQAFKSVMRGFFSKK